MTPFYIPPRDELKWIGVDLDGTIAEQIWPEPGIGDPITPNIEKMIRCHQQGYKIMIHTSRPWSDYEMIRGWLIQHGLTKYIREIQCGKPLFYAYVDDKAVPADKGSWV